MAKIILTGDRPTGRLHIGHYVGSLRERVKLQNSGNFDEIYIMIADAQALTDNAEHPEKVRSNIIEVALDYLACGIDPAKSTIFIQSAVPELTELSFYYMNLVTLSRLQRNPTVKAEIKMRDFEKSIPVGFLTYPISQAADITAFEATTVPAGEDQEPMIEQCKEIVRKFNSIYGDTLVEPEILLPNNKQCCRLPGIDGKAKMSKSLGNCIYLSDTPDEIKTKVMSMFTDPNHLRIEDKGKVEGNTVFTYLDAFATDEHFAEFLPDYKNLDELKAHYRRGGLGDVKIKRFLINVLQSELKP
ncbi:MAG TPA: tryptophan--tRNA ligase, partial [Clostridiales bacterium]|nr:tryptophan--tRNA ligase [Clostridiales bacterium]